MLYKKEIINHQFNNYPIMDKRVIKHYIFGIHVFSTEVVFINK